MSEVVYPLSSRVRLGTFNGFGLHLASFTRVDASGRCFGTRWLTLLFVPVIPVSRYYLRQGAVTTDGVGPYSTTRTEYQIAGQARLNLGEILRTYLFWLVAPAFVLVPVIVLLSHADQITHALSPDAGWPVLVLIGVFILWLLGSIAVVVLLQLTYRSRWAPLREVRWA